MSKFRAGEWVRIPEYKNVMGPHITLLTEAEVESGIALFRDGTEVELSKCQRYVVRPAKPRRTLTLSQGIAWLAVVECMLGPMGEGWQITRFCSEDCVATGVTPLLAIIAARKALKVKP